MNSAERATRLRDMFQQIAPHGDMKSIATPSKEPSSNLETFEEGGPASDTALEKVARSQLNELSASELSHLEAIIMPLNRPAVFVRGTSYDDLPESWSVLNTPDVKSRLGNTFPSIGRINLPNSPLIPYGGTGFVVGDGLLMTNRHVVQLFSRGVGLNILYTSGDAAIGFKHELGEPDTSVPLTVSKVELIHPYWDMALLRVEGLTTQKPLVLSSRNPADFIGLDIIVVGYPAIDSRNDIALQNRIFSQTFHVKRLQPGVLRPAARIRSFANTVDALTHDASTLGGNSGSAIIDVKTGDVLALHFAGEYLKANYAVPMYELAGDSRLSGKLNFSTTVPPTDKYDAAWQRATEQESIIVVNRDRSAGDASADASDDFDPIPAARELSPGLVVPSWQAKSQTVTLTVPIQISLSLGQPTSVSLGAAPAVGAGGSISPEEGVVIDQDYSDREGYEPDFVDGLHVPLPTLSPAMKTATCQVPLEHRKHGDPYELTYYHYSIYMNKVRRTAWFSAANVDGKRRPAIGKREGDRWYCDTRIEKTEQLTQKAFEHGIDRGHLTRREDTAWGANVNSATRANNDTFHFTNCALQASLFNRGKDRWQGLEQYLLEKHAKKDKRRMIVITGPVFAANDPIYKNDAMDYSVRCPLQFWKVCVLVREDGRAAATAFLLGQNEITDLPGFEESFDVGVTQITIAKLQKKTGLTFGELARHDHFARSGPGSLESAESAAYSGEARVIREPGDICI
jgi:endonuclease G, mitochondrial